MKRAFNYSLIRFMPYADSGEFVVIGLIAEMPQAGLFDFKINTEDLSRVANFFPFMSESKIRSNILFIKHTLQSYRDWYDNDGFSSLTNDDNGLITFSKPSTSMCDDFDEEIDRIYDLYVMLKR